MIYCLKNLLSFRLIKHGVCGVSFFVAARDVYINKHHLTRYKSNQFFLVRDSGLVYAESIFFCRGLVLKETEGVLNMVYLN
jgi:hypothetical protein